MSASSSARRAMERAQGTFQSRWPPRGTTGEVKGPARVEPLAFKRARDNAAPVLAPVKPEPERRTLAAMARGVIRAMARMTRARGRKGE